MLENIFRPYEFNLVHSMIGQVGIALSVDWAEPEDPYSTKHRLAAMRSMQFSIGWFANPIFKNGDYPKIMKTKVCVLIPLHLHVN